MKKLILLFTVLTATLSAAAQAPAFPGAEGHGRYTAGGRGGKIVHVTNLNDSGTGSFRQAVKGSDKKIVVFDVAGVIALASDVSIGANTTILGQTAPAPGITLRYYTVNPNGNNIVMRFIRIRRGEEKDVNDGADASTARHFTGMMIDHCSMSWSIDEVASFYDNNNFTMQWCTVGESLNNAGHGKGAHGYGGIWGGKLASFHHNLICHVNNRSPRFNGARYDWTGYTGNQRYSEFQWENAVQSEIVDFRNCVIYNCGNGCYGGPGGGYVNMINNYYKTGPAGSTSRTTQISVANSTSASGYEKYWDMTSRYYIKGNRVNNSESYDWSNIAYDSGVQTINGERYTQDPYHYYGSNVTYVKNTSGTDCVKIKLDQPTEAGTVTTHTANQAFNKVLGYAGASLVRDNVDERYMTEAKNGTATYTGSVTGKKGRIDKVSDVNGYTEANFGTGSRETGFDSDNDGIPDAWETANGLNPNNATDASQFTLDPKKYYSNLEVYANSLVQDIMLSGNADAETTVDDYYPAYTKEDGTPVAAINYSEDTPQPGQTVSYTLSQSTNLGDNTSSTYFFDNDITITNKSSKGYATGSNNGIKYSAGVQYAINLPQDVNITEAIFTGYDNYTDLDAYLGEVNGVTYEADTYVFPKSKESVVRTVEIQPAASGTITFTPQGKQVVLSITLNGTHTSATGINELHSYHIQPNIYYNLQGLRKSNPTKGIYVNNGRKVIVK